MISDLPAITDESLKSLNNVDVRHVLFDGVAGTALIQFTFSPNEPDTVLELSRISFYQLSLDPDEGGDLAFVGQVDAFAFEDSGQKILSKLGYCFEHSPGIVRTLPEASGFYFHIEGDICGDIVCGMYSVRTVPFGSTAHFGI